MDLAGHVRHEKKSESQHQRENSWIGVKTECAKYGATSDILIQTDLLLLNSHLNGATRH